IFKERDWVQCTNNPADMDRLTQFGFTKMAYDSANLKPGDILVDPTYGHTEIFAGDGNIVGAHNSSLPASEQISLTSNYGGWAYVFRYGG
ncbi:MAG: hypothetical protein IIY77_07140, partial [Lachnospiraceae bacterium]|nr:hypothetical protein [Lachnospiraceae bacterium]